MNGWRRKPNLLVRELEFRDYDEAKAVAEDLAEHVDDFHRHPGLTIDENVLRIEIENLHHADITAAEERLAQKVDARLAQLHLV
jgi:pterin-4a-carbinolamine dehydratase